MIIARENSNLKLEFTDSSLNKIDNQEVKI